MLVRLLYAIFFMTIHSALSPQPLSSYATNNCYIDEAHLALMCCTLDGTSCKPLARLKETKRLPNGALALRKNGKIIYAPDNLYYYEKRLPKGTYGDSCDGCLYVGHKLTCICHNNNPDIPWYDYPETSIIIPAKFTDIINVNGQLLVFISKQANRLSDKRP